MIEILRNILWECPHCGVENEENINETKKTSTEPL